MIKSPKRSRKVGFCVTHPKIKEIKITPYTEDGQIGQDAGVIEQRILVAVDKGDLADFQKLYLQNPSFVSYQGSNGKSLLHYAAAKDRISMIKLILRCGGDLNARDNEGNTSLHAATESESLESMEYLITKGANTAIKNLNHQAVIHLAVEMQKHNALRLLVRYPDKVDLLLGSEHGRTALHLAAINNFASSAEIVLSVREGRTLTHMCENGTTAVHAASRNASYITLKRMLEFSDSLGLTNKKMMTLADVHGNSPLHSAVHSGEIEVVRLCLENGALINQQQNDLTSPVHLACSQGALELVRLMFAMRPVEEKKMCLELCDVQGMTPLHYAAMFDHLAIVKFLVGEGANVNAQDKEKRSPLLLAATRAGWSTVQVLLQMGADISDKDISKRNLLHLIITHGGSLEDFVQEIRQISQEKLDILLNDKDGNGCTPLHYASRMGKFKSSESLIQLGASITLKNNEKESPLHFASRYGRYNTVVQLLQGDKGLSIINEVDGEGMTPLHIASQNGHTRVVQLLLNRGALLQRDHTGKTSLHMAAQYGFLKTMQVLLSVHSQLLDQVDKNGDTSLHVASAHNQSNVISLLLSLNCKFVRNVRHMTPLDIALKKKHQDAARALATHEQRAHEILCMDSVHSVDVISNIIAVMPDVFKDVLDKCLTHSGIKDESSLYNVKYEFKYLQYSPKVIRKLKQSSKDFKVASLPALNTMVTHRRLDLLCHPVCQKYIQVKWNAYGMHFHLLNVFLYVVFMALLTIVAAFLISQSSTNKPPDGFSNSESRATYNRVSIIDLQSNRLSFNKCSTMDITPPVYFATVAVLVFAFVNSLKEMVQFYQQGFKYMLDAINVLEWLLYITSAIMVNPVFTCDEMTYHLESTSIAIFVAWFNFLLYLQRFDMVGIYVVMFLEILKTLVKALMIFSILLIAFGLAFHILLSKVNVGFSNVPISIIRVFSMMLGEFDIMGTFLRPSDNDGERQKNGRPVDYEPPSDPLPQFTLGLLVMFFVLMPILLVNLLIGLAVGDIDGVRRNAHLKRVAMQVEMHTELERKLPQFVLERVFRETVIEYPNSISHRRCPWLWTLIQRIWGTVHAVAGGNSIEDANKFSTGSHIFVKELDKQKNVLRRVSASIEQLHVLVKLVVQKMEIRTEADDCDEGDAADEQSASTSGSIGSTSGHRGTSSAFSSNKFAGEQVSRVPQIRAPGRRSSPGGAGGGPSVYGAGSLIE